MMTVRVQGMIWLNSLFYVQLEFFDNYFLLSVAFSAFTLLRNYVAEVNSLREMSIC